MSHMPIPVLPPRGTAGGEREGDLDFSAPETFCRTPPEPAEPFELPEQWESCPRAAVWSLQRAGREQWFLAQASEAFASSLDCRATLRTVAHMAVGSIADFCIVDLVAGDGSLQRLVAEDLDDAYVGELEASLAAVSGNSGILSEVLDSGEVQVFEELDPRGDDVLIEALRRHGATSLVIAPMVARGRRLGAIILGSKRPDRPYGPRAADLAANVARRAAIALDNARLYEEARRAVRARDDMLAVVAHDLRNPLGVISMAAELIRDLANGEAGMARLGLEMIHKSAGQMNRLIQDLLDATRIEAGRLRVECRPEAPESILQEAYETLRPLVEGHALTLVTEVTPGLPNVSADRERLIQAIGNLVGNSVKFTPAGGQVTLHAQRAKGSVRFGVRDTGPGIPAEHLPHLFDRFWQEKGADRRGLGLGLAIVKGIVEAHGGHVGVRSVVGEGTEIHFVIPAQPDGAAQTP